MTLPSNLQMITVQGTFLDSTGAPLSGALSFAPNVELVDLNNAALYPTPLVATLDASGHFSISLICTDNPSLYPTGWSYTVIENVRALRSYPIWVPRGLGSSVDLSALMPIPLLPGQSSVPVVGSQPTYAQLSYAQTWTGSQTFQGEVSVPTPVNAADAVTKAYADAIALGLSVKLSVQESTTTALPANTYSSATLTASANGALTVDGIAVAAGDRVLVMNEAAAANNGIYTVTSTGTVSTRYVLQRASDMTTGAQIPGAFAFVEQGTVNAATGYVVAGKGPYTLGTTAITFTQVSGSGLTFGTGLTLAGKVLSLAAPVPVSLGGTGQTTTQATLDALAGAVTAGQYLRGTGTHVQLAAIPAADLPAASGATQGAVAYATSTGVLQSVGAATLGATGTVPDAGHIHPRPAHQFSVLAYGAKGDGKAATDGAITSTTNILTCATSAPFAPGDVGKAIMIKGAAATNPTSLITTIIGYTSASTVTLATTAATTTTAAMVLWGTDDTSAFQQAVNAATTWAQAHSQYAEILVPPPTGYFYAIAAALSTAMSGNAQITLPIIGPTIPKVTLAIVGGENSAGCRYWNQTIPAFNGPTLLSFGVFATAAAQTTSITGAGNPAVIGGPTGKNGYGTSALLWSNMMVHIRGLTILTTHSAAGLTYSALNLHGVACAELVDFSYGTNGVFLLTQGGGDFNAISTFSTGISIGVLMPSAGNNDCNQIRNVTCQGGYTYGFYATEHTAIHGLTLLYCWSGLCIVGIYGDSGSGVGALHAIHTTQVSIENCSYHLNIIGLGNNGPIMHGVLDTEGTVEVRDTTSGTSLASARGEIRFAGSISTINLTSGSLLRMISEWQQPGPVAAPPAVTVGTAQMNAFWRPANVVFTGGTAVTGISVSNLAGGPSAPALTSIYTQASGALPAQGVTARIGPGQWYEVLGTGSGVTAAWTLD